jgi:uncharacterized membrane protein
MSSISIVFGVLLTILGVGLYAGSDLEAARRLTALIPAAFGVLLFVCGIVARNEKARKHAMHFAALLGLIGCVMPLVMVIRRWSTTGEFDATSRAGGGQLAMAALCGIFVALCVKSFIDARKARKQTEGP